MLTQLQIDAFRLQLEGAGISLTSPRAHSALSEYKEGLSAQDCIAKAVKNESATRKMWISDFLDPWCERHGLTREQGLSVAFKDVAYNPANPRKDLVTLKDLFSWGGQQNDFFTHLQAESGVVSKEAAGVDLVAIAGGQPDHGNQVTVGFVREDGDIAVLATLNNVDDHLPRAEFRALAKLIQLSLEDACPDVQIFDRQDAPDYVTPENSVLDSSADLAGEPFVHTDAQCKTLADKFLENLLEDVGAEKYREIRRRNIAQTDVGICHSHDFLDANMTMASAFESVMNCEVDLDNGGHTRLWNDAWNLAINVMVNTASSPAATSSEVDAWFEGSKATDDNGRPLALYRKSFVNESSTPRLHFTDNPDDSVGGMLPAYLKMQNPLDLRTTGRHHPGFNAVYEHLDVSNKKMIVDNMGPSGDAAYCAIARGIVETPQFLEGVNCAGFDGVIFNRSAYAGGPAICNYKVLDDSQVMEVVGLAPLSMKISTGSDSPSP